MARNQLSWPNNIAWTPKIFKGTDGVSWDFADSRIVKNSMRSVITVSNVTARNPQVYFNFLARFRETFKHCSLVLIQISQVYFNQIESMVAPLSTPDRLKKCRAWRWFQWARRRRWTWDGSRWCRRVAYVRPWGRANQCAASWWEAGRRVKDTPYPVHHSCTQAVLATWPLFSAEIKCFVLAMCEAPRLRRF